MLPKSFGQIFHPPPKYVTDAKLDASWAQHCKIFFWKLGSMHSSTPPSLIKGCAISYRMHNHIIIAASCHPRGQSGNMQIFSLTSSPLVIHQHPFGFLSFVTPIDRSILQIYLFNKNDLADNQRLQTSDCQKCVLYPNQFFDIPQLSVFSCLDQVLLPIQFKPSLGKKQFGTIKIFLQYMFHNLLRLNSRWSRRIYGEGKRK